MLRFNVIVREPGRGFQYVVGVDAGSSDEAKRKVQDDLDEWNETDEVLNVLLAPSRELRRDEPEVVNDRDSE